MSKEDDKEILIVPDYYAFINKMWRDYFSFVEELNKNDKETVDGVE